MFEGSVYKRKQKSESQTRPRENICDYEVNLLVPSRIQTW